MTKEEYLENVTKDMFNVYDLWSKPKYDCPKCGGGMRKNLLTARCLLSYPPQYRYTYQCNKCGFSEELGV